MISNPNINSTMATKVAKKGRNPGAVDNWLETLGLYRKNVAYDETCLFRAVSEQLFDCQIYHERVRKQCLSYARENFPEFVRHANSEEKWQKHLDLLEKHMVVCGDIEIDIISRRYKRDVIIFDATHQKIIEATTLHESNALLLCLMDEDHYDVVYKKEHIVTAGFCQSIVYKILYEEVFQIPNVDDIVNTMLYDKNHMIPQIELLPEKKTSSEVNNNEVALASVEEADDEQTRDEKQLALLTNNIAPFPFKVAKALDPTIYRNIEYDSWGEVRREMRLGDWYYGDDKLILGTRCVLKISENNETHDCYIQEIIKDQNKCVVYLTQLAQRRTVNYTDLSPESDAKPWPLPYRFSKNLVISGSPQLPPIERVPKAIKKRNKDKRRTKSCSENTAISNMAPASSEAIENVNAYAGIPLQMQNPHDHNYQQQEVSTEAQTEGNAQEMPADNANAPNRYQWDHWRTYLPSTPDSFVWSQAPPAPQSLFNFNLKPLMASAPVTPDVVSYHDPNFPYYLNYHVDSYQPYAQWTPSQAPETQPSTPKLRISNTENRESPEEGKSHTDSGHYQYSQNDNNYDQQPACGTPQERPMLCTALTPQNTPVEVFSPMIPLPPGTPVIYASAPPEMTEMMMPSTSIMYTPPVDMQYVSPGPYVYPPTPPAAWYPGRVNSHGFIFPPRPQ